MKSRKAIYGPDRIFGGSSSDPADEEAEVEETAGGEVERKDGEIEPVFFHFLPKLFYDNLVGSWSACAILDLSPGQGELAKVAAERRLPYLGIALTDEHATSLKEDRISVFMFRFVMLCVFSFVSS